MAYQKNCSQSKASDCGQNCGNTTNCGNSMNPSNCSNSVGEYSTGKRKASKKQQKSSYNDCK